MKRMMLLLPIGAALLAVACLASRVDSAVADEKKPIAVAALAGYDRLKADIGYLGRISDNAELDVNLEAVLKLFTRGQGLAGLDKARPWGAALFVDESDRPRGVAFIPVDDAAKLFEVLTPVIGAGEDAGEGVKKFGRGPRTQFVKQHGSWLLLSDKREMLDEVSGDPARWLGDLPVQYDAAVRVFASDLPQRWAQRAMEGIQRFVERETRRRGQETDLEHQMRTELVSAIATVMKTTVEQIDSLTVGWNIDAAKERATLDICLTAKPGSILDRETAAAIENLKTRFAGVQQPGAMLNVAWGGKIPEFKAAVLRSVFGKLHTQATEDLEESNRPEEEKEVLKTLIDDLGAMLTASAESRQLDSAVSVVLKPGESVVVAAARVAKADRFEHIFDTIKRVVNAAQPGALEWASYEKQSHGELTIHSVSLPIEEPGRDAENLIRLVGEKLDIAVATGADVVFVAAGFEAKKALLRAIDGSSELKPIKAVQASLALKSLAETIAKFGARGRDREQAAAVARALADCEGSDRIHLTAEPIPHGLRWRLELEPGVLRLIGKMAQEAQMRRQ